MTDGCSVWRPLRGPVVDWPLATMDYRSCDPDLIYPTDLLDKADGYRGQTVTFGHSDKQKWYYLDGHRTDEVTLIKIWDNKNDVVGKCECSSAIHGANNQIDSSTQYALTQHSNILTLLSKRLLAKALKSAALQFLTKCKTTSR